MKLFDFVHARNGVVELTAHRAADARVRLVRRSVRDARSSRKSAVTEQINALYELCFKYKAFAEMTELQWFLTEQVEEEKTAREMVAKFRLVGDDPGSLLDLDRELGSARPRQESATDDDDIWLLGDFGAWINAHALWPHLPVWSYARPRRWSTRTSRPPASRSTCIAARRTAASRSIRPSRTSCASGCGCGRRCRPGSGWPSTAAITPTSTPTEDPHSPIVYGIWRVVFLGTALYHTAAHNDDVIEQYGKGTPDDVLERRLYTPLSARRARS